MNHAPRLIAYHLLLGSISEGLKLMGPSAAATVGSAAAAASDAEDHGERAARSGVDSGQGQTLGRSSMNQNGENPQSVLQEEKLPRRDDEGTAGVAPPQAQQGEPQDLIRGSSGPLGKKILKLLNEGTPGARHHQVQQGESPDQAWEMFGAVKGRYPIVTDEQ